MKWVRTFLDALHFNNNDDITIYFKNGILNKITPEVFDYYSAKYLVSDGIKYDLECEEGINHIPIPKFYLINPMIDYSVTVFLDYVLRMKAGNLSNRGLNDLSIICLKKSIELMPYSGICWSSKDYLRLPIWLIELGRFKEAEEERLRLAIMLKLPDNNFFSTFDEKQKYMDRIEYYKIYYQLPDIAPKSFGGYRTMKKKKSKNYKNIKDIALKNGIMISD